MKKILMTICLIGGLAMLWSCSDDKDSYPVPSDIENLKATPAPGQITLSWTNPADENLYYVQIEYTIGATGKSYRKQVSQYANELVIDNLLQKYGESWQYGRAQPPNNGSGRKSQPYFRHSRKDRSGL